jgi:hypothetical protein
MLRLMSTNPLGERGTMLDFVVLLLRIGESLEQIM